MDEIEKRLDTRPVWICKDCKYIHLTKADAVGCCCGDVEELS